MGRFVISGLLRSEECPLKIFPPNPLKDYFDTHFSFNGMLIRILMHYPTFEVAFVYSSTNGPKVLASTLTKRDTDL